MYMIRISTQTLFETGGARIGELQSGLAKTSQQVSSGRRLLTPSDDPVAAARAVEVGQSKAVNEQYGVNRKHALNMLSTIEDTLAAVTSLLLDVKDIAIAAGNPTLTDMDRASQASELRARLDDLLGLANSRDANGDYLFSGFRIHSTAFVETTPAVVSYQGDGGIRMIQIDASRQLAINVSGDTVFQGGGVDMFQTIGDLITLLKTPGTTGLSAGLAAVNQKLGVALDNVLAVRANIGAGMQAIDFFEAAGQARNLQYDQVLSELQDLDYAEALTRLSQQQITLEAAQKSFVKSASLSLFNFI